MLADSDLLPLGRDLAGWLRGQRFGEVHVIDAVGDAIIDVNDEPAVELTAALEDPRGDTWPLDDVLALRSAVREAARDRNPSLLVYVNFRPVTDEQQEDDEVPER